METSNKDLVSNKHVQLYYDHEPVTDILKRIEKAVKDNRGLLPFVVINRDIAKDLLTLNTGNRNRLAGDVARMANDMKRGKWIFWGQMIVIDETGRLVNGQTELGAIIASNTEHTFHIQAGVYKGAFAVIDIGKPKSVFDTLRTLGFSNVYNLGSAINHVINITKYRRMGTTRSQSQHRVNNQDVQSWLENTRNVADIDRAVKLANNRLAKGDADFITKSTWAAMFFIFARIDLETASYFCEKLSTAEDINKTGRDAAIYLLRRDLRHFQKNIKDRPERGLKAKDYRWRYIFHAWNVWRDNKRPEKLNPDFSSPELEKPL